MLLIQNGHITDPYTRLNAVRDILIDDAGMITSIGTHIAPPPDCPCFDATGQTVAPGFVDGHTHFRDPGYPDKEDIRSVMTAAAAGGYATIIGMANTSPVCDTPETIQYVLEQAAAVSSPVQVLQAGAITKGLQGKELTDFAALLEAGAPCLTDDGMNLTNAGLCYQAMEESIKYGALLSFHEEDPALIPSNGVNFGSEAAALLGVPGARAVAETVMIGRDIALALDTGARVLFQHISCAQSVEIIRAGKALGAQIYAEVTPHHLSLTEDAVIKYGTAARMNPPLRKEMDRQMLIEGLADGTIDMIATDHAPHTAAEKAQDFAHAPSGIIGLETAFSVCNTCLVKQGRFDRMGLIEKMSKIPAEVYGLTGRAIAVGNYARLVLLDWDAEVTYTTYHSKSSNSPFTGMPLMGKATAVVQGDVLQQNN